MIDIIGNIVLVLINVMWLTGMFLVMASSAVSIMQTIKFEKTGWSKVVIGYSIRDLRRAALSTGDEKIRKKLINKIRYRKTAYWLFILTPITIIIRLLIVNEL